jgi:murein DD-endopeptidase MepM/ murein hydrolase activator NlpD
MSTLYAHASKLLVSQNQTVSKGDTIALVGNTGNSYGAHLHFEIRVNDKPVNPLNYFR